MFFFLGGVDHSHLREGVVEEIVDAGAVLGSDGKNGSADAMENAGAGFLGHGVDFIDGDDERLAGGTQEARQLFIERSEARLAVHDQNEQGGFLDGDMGLAEDFLGDQRAVVGDEAAGIHDFQGAAAPLGFAIDAVARDAGLVGDDGAARAGEAIEERGLAHIGASDDDERWEAFGHEIG